MNQFMILLVICLIGSSLTVQNIDAINPFDELSSSSASSSGKQSASLAIIDNPALVVQVLENLIRNIALSPNEIQSLAK